MDLHVDSYYIAESYPLCVGVNPRIQDDIDHMFNPLRSLSMVLQPWQRILLASLETVYIPPDKCGLITLRSTWARLGLMAPPTVADPGFKGQLTMEVINTSVHPILIRSGDSLWGLIMVPSQEPMYQGRYQDQAGIQIPKALQEAT